MYLPTKHGCPLIFLQQILALKKNFFRRGEVGHFRVPTWPELSVTKIWPQAVQQPRFLTYFPDTWTAEKKTEREFFWAILVRIQPDYVENLIKDCRTQREALRLGPRPPPVRQLNIHPMFAAALLSQPQTSSKSPFTTGWYYPTYPCFHLVFPRTLGRRKGGNVLTTRVEVQNRRPPPIRRITPNVQMAPYARDWQMREERPPAQDGDEVIEPMEQYDYHGFMGMSVNMPNSDPPEEEKMPDCNIYKDDDRALSDCVIINNKFPGSKKRSKPT
jgi:hypothetical protein